MINLFSEILAVFHVRYVKRAHEPVKAVTDLSFGMEKNGEIREATEKLVRVKELVFFADLASRDVCGYTDCCWL